MATFKFIQNSTDKQAEEILSLYKSAKWWEKGEQDDIAVVKKIVSGSFLFLVALENNKIIAMGRAISDGVSDAYIQDMTVAEQFRHNAIGRELLNRIREELFSRGISWIGVIAENNTKEFYQKSDFQVFADATPMTSLLGSQK